MKVKSALILTPTFPYFPNHEGVNGGSNFIYQKVKYLQNSGIKPVVITSECPQLNEFEKNKVKKEGLPIETDRFKYFWPQKFQRLTYMAAGVPDQLFVHKNILAWIQLPFFILSFFLRSLPHVKNCDLIHCHWVLTAIPGLLLKWIFKKPLFLTIREGNPNLISRNLFMRFIVRNVDYLIANTDEYFQHMIVCGSNTSKFIKIRNGVDPKFKTLEKKLVRDDLRISRKDILLISASYLIPRKNPSILLRAFFVLEKKYPNLTLVFAGEGPLEESLRQEAIDFNCGDKVHFLGNISHEDLNNWYNASDIFCLMTKSDGISNSVVEAMACNLPVITTNVGGFSEIIKNGDSGFLIEPNDFDNLVSLIEKLIRDSNMRIQTGFKASKQLAHKGINWEINSKLHSIAYQKAFN